MKLSRLGLAGVVAACAIAGVVAAGVLASPSGVRATVKPVVITVTASPPTTYVFKFSPSKISAGATTFKVMNKGTLPYDFKICTKPAASDVKNACVGKDTPLIQPGKSASVTVTLKKGKYEYLSTVPGYAIAGLKGLLGVGGVKVSNSGGATSGGTTTPKGGTTTKPVTTTPGSGTAQPTFPTGNAANGKSAFIANCGSCHALAAAGTAGAVDLDKSGYAVSDVEHQAYNGGEGMPAFSTTLTNQQIADIAAFVAANDN